MEVGGGGVVGSCIKLWISLTWGLVGDSKESGDAQTGASRDRICVHPETHPWDDHDQDTRQVTLNQMKAYVPLQSDEGAEAAVVSWQETGNSEYS